jgi:hypothetical protein
MTAGAYQFVGIDKGAKMVRLESDHQRKQDEIRRIFKE